MGIPKGNELKIMRLLHRYEPLCPIDMNKHDESLSLNGLYTVLDRMSEGPAPSVDSWHEKRPGTRGFGVRMFKLQSSKVQARCRQSESQQHTTRGPSTRH